MNPKNHAFAAVNETNCIKDTPDQEKCRMEKQPWVLEESKPVEECFIPKTRLEALLLQLVFNLNSFLTRSAYKLSVFFWILKDWFVCLLGLCKGTGTECPRLDIPEIAQHLSIFCGFDFKIGCCLFSTFIQIFIFVSFLPSQEAFFIPTCWLLWCLEFPNRLVKKWGLLLISVELWQV